MAIRILHVLGSLSIGGAQSLVMNLYRQIDREQVQFDFILDHKSESMNFEQEVYSLGGKIYRFPSFTGGNYKQITKTWYDFFEEHSEYKVLHSHIRSYASIYIPIAKHFQIKTIVHSHSTSNGKGIKAMVKKFLQYPLRFQSDYFFSCSLNSGIWLFGNQIVSSNRYFVIKNGVDFNRFFYNINIRKQCRMQFNINAGEFVYGHCGRFHESKNHIFLINVFKEIKRIQPNAHLWLIGEGELKDDINNYVKNMGLADSVEFMGAVANPEYYYQGMDAFLFPSKWEGLPVSVIEAQISGLPCFISNKITTEVNITNSLVYLDIDNNESLWTNIITNCDLSRKSLSPDINKSDFNISNQALKLTNFYKSIWG